MTHLGLFQLYGYCYQDSEDIPDTLTTITELGAPVEMIQLLQTSWEDRFRVSREEGQLALGSWLGWFSLRRSALQSSLDSSLVEGGREGCREVDSAISQRVKKNKPRQRESWFCTPVPHTHIPPHSAWLQEGQCPRSRKTLRSSWPALCLHALGRTHTEMELQGGVPRFPLPISPLSPCYPQGRASHGVVENHWFAL